MSVKQLLGRQGEQAAVSYLEKNGCNILERNFRFGRAGELDIIVRDGEYICFVEVKSRTGIAFGTPAEAVNSIKQLHMKKAALYYIHNHCLEDAKIRFDVIEVIFLKNYDSYKIKSIEWIRNAFA